MKIFVNWKTVSAVWAIVEPYVIKLIEKAVPSRITSLYEQLAKYSQPAITSLFKLKAKIAESPNALDNACFDLGVNALEAFANYLLVQVAELKK